MQGQEQGEQGLQTVHPLYLYHFVMVLQFNSLEHRLRTVLCRP